MGLLISATKEAQVYARNPANVAEYWLVCVGYVLALMVWGLAMYVFAEAIAG